MDLSNLETNINFEHDGVWVDLEDADKTLLLIARIGNPRYNSRMRARMKTQQYALKMKELSIEAQEAIVTEVISETVLLDWKNLKYKGKAIKYSPTRAFEIMTQIKDFRNLVVEIADDMETFKIVSQEEDSKNSKAS